MASDRVNWRDSQSLTAGFKQMLDNQIGCDITFFIGKEKSKVCAHKLVLIRCSEVFEAMFLGDLRHQSKDIEIPDVDKDIFLTFLDFVYDCDIQIGPENAAGLLYVAKKYSVEPLVGEIRTYFFTDMGPDIACTVLDLGSMYEDTELKVTSLEYIQQNAAQCLQGDGFKNLSQRSVEDIVKSDELDLEKDQIYTAVIQWAEQECSRKKKPLTDENKRRVLGNILYQIRFSVMDKSFFAKSVAGTNILTEKEKVVIFRAFFDCSLSSGKFAGTARKNKTVPDFPGTIKPICTKYGETCKVEEIVCRSCSTAGHSSCQHCGNVSACRASMCCGCVSCASCSRNFTFCPFCGNYNYGYQ